MPDESLFDLAGRRALVTGGSRGIGAATARLLARCGADVALTYRTRRAEAEAVAKDITALGRRASVHRVELSTRRNVDATIDGIALAWDGLDILIGNAGIWPSNEAAVRDMPDERWSQTMAENVDGMFYSTRAALRFSAATPTPSVGAPFSTPSYIATTRSVSDSPTDDSP